jgi:hypothetical protein
MARLIVMPDATHLRHGIRGTILYAEQVRPEQLDDLRSSEEILERLERAVREDATASRAFGERDAGRGSCVRLHAFS